MVIIRRIPAAHVSKTFTKSTGFFESLRYGGYGRACGGYDNDADEDECASDCRAKAQRFAGKEVSNENGNDGIDVSIRSDVRGGLVVEQPMKTF